MNRPELSIIIVSYNCKDLLSEAITSVYTYVTNPEIIVVDNASSDGTEEFIKKTFPAVHFIANKKNLGFSAANNQGFQVSTGQNILLLNPDAMLINKDLEKALAFLEKDENCIIGPKLLNEDRSLQDSVLPMPSFKDVLLESLFLTYFFWLDPGQVVKKGNFALSGACLLLTRQNYEQLQGMDEDLFWMDDVDLCYRARQAGMKIVYFPDWSVVHIIGQSGKKNYKVSISNQLISKLKFFKKHGQHWNFLMSAIFIELHILLRLLCFLVLALFSRMHRLKFSAYWYSQIVFFKYIFTGQKQTF